MGQYTVTLPAEKILELITAQAELENPAHLAGVYLDGQKKFLYRLIEGGVSLRLKPGHWGLRVCSGGEMRVEIYSISAGTAVHATFVPSRRVRVNRELSIGVVLLLGLAMFCGFINAVSESTFQPGMLLYPGFLLLLFAGQTLIFRELQKAGQEEEKIMEDFLSKLLESQGSATK